MNEKIKMTRATTEQKRHPLIPSGEKKQIARVQYLQTQFFSDKIGIAHIENGDESYVIQYT